MAALADRDVGIVASGVEERRSSRMSSPMPAISAIPPALWGRERQLQASAHGGNMPRAAHATPYMPPRRILRVRTRNTVSRGARSFACRLVGASLELVVAGAWQPYGYAMTFLLAWRPAMPAKRQPH
jgi:hypothetical protein